MRLVAVESAHMAGASEHRLLNFPLMIAFGGYEQRRLGSCGADEKQKNNMACDLYVTVPQQLGFATDSLASMASMTSNLNGALL